MLTFALTVSKKEGGWVGWRNCNWVSGKHSIEKEVNLSVQEKQLRVFAASDKSQAFRTLKNQDPDKFPIFQNFSDEVCDSFT